MKNEKCNKRRLRNHDVSADKDISHFSFIIYHFYSFLICLIFALVFFVIEISRYKRSLQSFIISSYSVGVNKLVSLSRSIQYSVSAHSFNDIVTFTRNSFLLTAYCASVRFAPIEVPERNNCCARVNSCFLSHKCL